MSQTTAIAEAESESKEPLRVPSLEVMVDGAKCEIFGINHTDTKLITHYRNLFDEERTRELSDSVYLMRRPALWLCENNLSVYLPGRAEITEMLDHSVGAGALFFSFKRTTILPMVLSLAATAGVLVGMSYFIYGMFRLGIDPEYRNKIIKESKDKNLKEDLKDATPEKQFLECLETCEKTIKETPFQRRVFPGNFNDCRSLYMAQFIRNYHPGEDKKVVVGAKHVRPVALLLKYHPTNLVSGLSSKRYQEITDLAKMHATLAETNRWGYKIGPTEEVGCRDFAQARIGTLSGSLLWLSAASMAFYYACSG